MFIEFIIRLALNPLIEIRTSRVMGNWITWEGNAAYKIYVPFCKVWKFNHHSKTGALRKGKWNAISNVLDSY